MPLKTYKHQHGHKKHPKHYQKVYWPYLPLILIVLAGLVVGQPLVARSQRSVLAYAAKINRQSLLDATNQQRLANRRHQLSLNLDLNRAAQAKASDMAKRDYWSHNTPDGQEPWVFIQGVGYTYQKAGENLAYGFATSPETVSGWMNSPSHRANLLDNAYQDVGFGIAKSSNYQRGGPETIVVAMYAKPVTASAPAASTLASATPAKGEPVYNTTVAQVSEPNVKSISKAQALTGGHVPWIGFVIGLLSGASMMYLLFKHGWAVRRMIKNGEKFVLQHPLTDLTVVAFLALCALLSQSVGLIR